ncbi:MAG: formate dehydrogenase accessory sulfurtransferase FdhD [Siculibacillus sp.]|nr:formate dehydrogenase accessory sulfurtransferase FdhD [Siculibacillus sp.]
MTRDDAAALHPATRRVVAHRHGPGGPPCPVSQGTSDAAGHSETVAEETPVAITYNGHSFAVMMASPSDLTDFALGFSLSEGVVESAEEFLGVEVVPLKRGVELVVRIVESRALALRARHRALAGRTGCGLCGVDSIAEAMRPIPRLTVETRISAAAIDRAVAAFPAEQPLNRRTGATHAAAFADLSGAIRLLREDVGRHNALDKLIGGLAVGGIDPASGFIVVSSRCSYEMVHKTASAGAPLVTSVSAPTGLAVELAEKVGVALVAFARDGRFTVYAGCERITE